MAPCQESSGIDTAHPDLHANARPNDTSGQGSRRILGILPNYRTSPSLADYKPLSSGEKFKIAFQDSFDRGTFVSAAAIGGLSQLSNGNKSFGQGGTGFARYFGAAYGDLLIGNYMTEAIYPSMLRQDPRYFRRGCGSGSSRFGYAISRVFRTRRDSGGTQFNYSEWLGNSTAVGISNAYYRDQRSVGEAVSKLAFAVGVDAFGNVLKEFWPDLQHKLSKKSRNQSSAEGTR